MLDTKTLIVTLIVILLIGGSVHVMNWLVYRNSRSAKWCMIGICLQALSLITAALINLQAEPATAMTLAVNYMGMGGSVLLLYGTADFSQHPLPRWIYGALTAFIVVGAAWFTFIQPSPTLRMVTFALTQFAVNGLILSRLGHIARRDGRIGVLLITASIVGFYVLMGAIVVWQLLTQPPLTGLYSAGPVVPAAMLTVIACKTAMMFGYLMLSTNYSQTRLGHLALSDGLTKLPNRRAFEQEIAKRLASARKQDQLIALAIFDIDHFKRVNDEYGHDAGDDVLRHLGRVAANALRPKDFIARVGGEEFAVLFDVEGVAELVMAANRLRLAIEIDRPLVGGVSLLVTVSVGAVMAMSGPEANFTTLYRAADQALYQAKTAGRNRVVVGEVEPDQPDERVKQIA